MRDFDTAPYYGFGLSERRLGDALRRRAGRDPVISTKVGQILEADTSPTLTLAAAALQFPLAQPTVQCVIPGIGEARHAHLAQQLIDQTIPADFWAELVDARLLDAIAPVPQGAG